jgi:CO dehydrogenase maturation factor
MKIAVSGKGGVGKTMVSALLARAFADAGYSVLAIDADPDANLAAVLGFPDPEGIVPISQMKELIEERTGAKPGAMAPLYKLNPRVDDIPEKYARVYNGIRLMVMGQVKRGGSGCYCPENALLQSLMAHLLIVRNEVIIMDMVAGIEHFGRATARSVDKLLVVVEPGRQSLDTAFRIKKLAGEIGLVNLAAVGNKIRTPDDRDFIAANLPGFDFLGFIPYDRSVIDADMDRTLTTSVSESIKQEIERIAKQLSGIQSPEDSRTLPGRLDR